MTHEDTEEAVNDFLDQLDKIDDCSGFIAWFEREDGHGASLCAANALQISKLIMELQKILMEIEGPTKDDTIQ
jgi:hypothetical protein